MSKRHSFASDRSADDRIDDADNDYGSDSDAGDDDFADGFSERPSLIGREAKIGMAIVLVLLIVLGVVLSKRLTAPADETAGQSDENAAKSGQSGRGAEGGKDPTASGNASSPQPTVVQATRDPSRKAPAGEVGEWSVVSDSAASSRASGAGSGSSMPSYMPAGTSGSGASLRYGRHENAGGYQAARTAPGMGSRYTAVETGAAEGASRGAQDPFSARSGGAGAVGSTPPYGTSGSSPPSYTQPGSAGTTDQSGSAGAGYSTDSASGNPMRTSTGSTLSVDPGAARPDAARTGSTDANYGSGYGRGYGSSYGSGQDNSYGATATAPPNSASPSGAAGASTAHPGYYSAGSARGSPYGSNSATGAPPSYGSPQGNTSGYGTAGTASAGGQSSYETNPPYGTNSSYGTAPSYGADPSYGTAGGAGGFVTQHFGAQEAAAEGTYRVQPGDTFSSIAEKHYGSSSYFKALVEHNRDKYPQPDRLDVGDVISVPTKEELVQTYGDLCPKEVHVDAERRQGMSLASTSGPYGAPAGRTYAVEEGDTLYDIARYELGKAARWIEIYELNREIIGADFDHLRPGTRLTLPGGDASDTLTRRPESAYQR